MSISNRLCWPATFAHWSQTRYERVAETIRRLWADRARPLEPSQQTASEGATLVSLSRDEVLLVMLSFDDSKPFTPVQIQKSLFLANDKAPRAFRNKYHFEAYDYGPFDRQVYADAKDLSRKGYVQIDTDERGRFNTYGLTDSGRRRARTLRSQLSEQQRDMLSRIAQFVSERSFYELVSAIYRGYPEMRKNSVFRD